MATKHVMFWEFAWELSLTALVISALGYRTYYFLLRRVLHPLDVLRVSSNRNATLLIFHCSTLSPTKPFDHWLSLFWPLSRRSEQTRDQAVWRVSENSSISSNDSFPSSPIVLTQRQPKLSMCVLPPLFLFSSATVEMMWKWRAFAHRKHGFPGMNHPQETP